MEKEIVYKGSKYKIYKGDKFNKWTVLDSAERRICGTSQPRAQILVKCDCGNIQEHFIDNILNGSSTQCKDCKFKFAKNVIKENYSLTGAHVSSIRLSAKYRNINFDITKEDIWNQFLKQNKKCAISGQDIYFVAIKSKKLSTASVDRIDSSKGYTKDNIQILHKFINKMKLDHNQDEFIKICKLIAKHNEHTE